MRESTSQQENNIPIELQSLYLRIEQNAQHFGMSPAEITEIKKECKIAYQHKKVLDKVEKKKK